jgi:signal transduction histidine kinase
VASRHRPRLRTVLLLVNLLVLALPLGGIAVLRLYESELVRGTETQLIALGAVVRDAYRDAYALEEGRLRQALLARPPPPPGWPALGLEPGPIEPTLDLHRGPVRPPAPSAEAAPGPVDPVAEAAGARLARVLRSSSGTTLVGVRVVDASGIVVATSGEEMGRSLARREEVRHALSGRPLSLLRERRSDRPVPPLQSLSRGQRYRVFVALPVTEGDRVLGAVVLSRTPLDIAKALYVHRGRLAVGGALALGVVVLVSALTAFAISRPMGALVRQAERVVRGERGAVVEVARPGTHEVARLSAALAEMARTLEQRADYIRTFATHLSHEFKTPLTTLRGTTELMRDHLDVMTPEERARFLRHFEDATQRLDRLVRRTLELARADVLVPGREAADVGSVLEGAAARARETGMEVEVVHDRGLGAVAISPEILDEVVASLLDNARLHGGAEVRARLTGRALPGEAAVEVEVSDDGAGVSPANLPRLFTPFFTTARERGGSGLGLAIARALLDAHGASIRLAGPGPGARWLLRLPLAP